MHTVPRLIDQFTPDNYQLSLDIDRPARLFRGTVTIQGVSQPDSENIALHAKDLEITSAHINGRAATASSGDFDTIVLSQSDFVAGKQVIVIGFSGHISDAMHGMYPCRYKHDGIDKELIATQFESHHAREVFPCIDEPAAKATFDVVLTTEPGVTVLGNLHPTSQRTEDDRLVTTFATTPRMSPYLLAWVYGELHKKTDHTKNGIEVNIYATPAQSPAALDFALDHAVKSIDFFEDYFDTPYPLPKSDHVALPDFATGAMENWGLITYRESTLLADPSTATVASKQYIATVISHELSHQWFGNLVTMKWWDDLWLNESFATIMEYIAVDAIHPEWNAWLDFASHESLYALRRDAIDGVQPVQVEVNHPDEILTLFDGAIVYAKGARLMRMCQAYIGDGAFQNGLRQYFAEFAYSNTEASDLWRCLSTASGKDVGSFMGSWLSQSGYPVVLLDDDGLKQTQFFIGEHEPSNKLWPIPLNAESDEDVPELLDTRALAMPIAEDERLNVGDTAHFITQYSEKHLARLLERDDLDDLARLQLLHEQILLARSGRVPSARLIDLLDSYRNETSQPVWEIMAVALSELKKFVEPNEVAEQQLRGFAGTLARPLYEKLGWSMQVGESESNTKLRSTVLAMMVYSQSEDVLNHVDSLFATGIESIDPELRPLVLSSVVYRSGDSELVNQLLEAYKSSNSADLRDDLCNGITSVRDVSAIGEVLSKLTDTSYIRTQDTARWFAYLMFNKHSRAFAWEWMTNSWDWIDEQFGGDKSYDDYPRYSASGLVTREQLEDYKEFFDSKQSIPALSRVIAMGKKEIAARVDLLERDSDAVHEKLQNT